MLASDDGNDHPGNNNPTRPENPHRRKGKGRKKVDMAKIQNGTNRQVTFSKRRGGIFKKASELCTLCGAECAILVFSPGDKPHSFGHPSVEAVTNRFLQASGGLPPPPAGVNSAERMIRAHNEAAMYQQNQQLVNAEAEVERTKQRRKEIDGLVPMQMGDFNLEQLGQLWNMALQINGKVEAKQKSLVSATAAAGVYGYGGAGGSGTAAPGYGYPVPPFPPIGGNGMGGYNYVDPSAVPFDGATGSSNPEADVDGDPDEANYGAPDESNYGGFPDNFGHPGY